MSESKVASARCYRDLILAKVDGEEVPEERLRVFRREDLLVRAAIAQPQALAACGVSAPMFEGADYRVAWEAIARATAVHTGDGPLHTENVLAEMRRGAEARYALHAGSLWMAQLVAQQPVNIGYALEVLVPEVVARHQLRVYNVRFQGLFDRIDSEPHVTGLYQELLTEAVRVTASPDGQHLGATMEGVALDLPKQSAIVPTGIGPIDRITGGGHGAGEMMVIGGGTNAGKSYAAERLLRNQARMGRPSLYVSAEDPLLLMLCRTLADYSSPKVTPVSIRTRLLNGSRPMGGAADPAIVQRAIASMGAEQKKLVYLYRTLKWPVGLVCSLIRRHAYMAGVKLVVVDYLQAIQADEPMTNKVQEMSQIIAALKRCAAACGVALVVLSQLNRESYKNGEEPGINDFKYCGDIENEAEIAVLLWRDDDGTLHAKLPKVKWVQAQNYRYIIPTDEVTGCFADWRDDFTPKRTEEEPRRKGRRTGGQP